MIGNLGPTEVLLIVVVGIVPTALWVGGVVLAARATTASSTLVQVLVIGAAVLTGPVAIVVGLAAWLAIGPKGRVPEA